MDFKKYVPPHIYKFYYGQLNDEEKRVYCELSDGYFAGEKEIAVSTGKTDVIRRAQRALLRDTPEIFFIRKIKMRTQATTGRGHVYPEYRFDEENIKNLYYAIAGKSVGLLSGIMGLPEIIQIEKIHDFLIRTVTYGDLEASYSHEVPGALIYGIAVCEGISKTFKYLCDCVGIKSIVVYGSTKEFPQETLHAWNIVYLGGKPYHMDVTFDYSLTENGDVRYDYFLLSDEEISADHVFDGMPECRYSEAYYEKNGRFVESKNALCKLVREEVRPGIQLDFQMPFLNGEPDKIASVVLNVISDECVKFLVKGYCITMSYNTARRIYRVFCSVPAG